jgi:hypothetical protein
MQQVRAESLKYELVMIILKVIRHIMSNQLNYEADNTCVFNPCNSSDIRMR